MMSVHWVNADIALRASRSDFDPKRVRPLKPMVGGGQISGVLSPRTGGPHSHAKISIFLDKKPFCDLAIGLRTPYFATLAAKMPKVSGLMPDYSRFRETATGDSDQLTQVISKLPWRRSRPAHELQRPRA